MPRESRYALRLPPELYAAVKEAAAQSNQSMNEYIVMALTQFMSVKDAHEKRIADLEIRVADLFRVVDATKLDSVTLAASRTAGKPSE